VNVFQVAEENNFMSLDNSAGTNRDQLLTVGDLQRFKIELLSEIKSLLNDSGKLQAKQWVRSNEVRKMLSVSAGTLQNLRINGTLSYTKVGGIILYKRDDIIRVLEENEISNSIRHGKG
jgi:hypothetical protein